jgi:hypothetical protein
LYVRCLRNDFKNNRNFSKCDDRSVIQIIQFIQNNIKGCFSNTNWPTETLYKYI